ncbi:hybrid sensor histidine kinase/response regulator transcription factor [Catalinimonas niigatensis]|uniref:hybrid sensor histidine kinase/response regulator transcription factor n=1 Tax=Catalinimonas niigatensis TaxID=1397264 RepID=UPI002666B334|nr:two-component regulator propeller domain-containing protein [Catalinimonas niigatensis]WPP52016.1 two-component regulator propeller domain-containing protein [Catalinimonas niigatensis]
MMVKIGSFLTTFCLGYAMLAQLSAQPEDIISRSYFMKDGLSNDFVTCLIQDNQGFLWIGTESGLNKFDGYHFTTYRENPLDDNSIYNDYITCLWEDQEQRLWIGTTTGLELFDLKSEKFLHPATDSLHPGKELNVAVKKIRERKDGKIWICTNQGIYLADPQTFSITRTYHFPKEVRRKSSRRANLNGNTFWDIAQASDGSLWAASEDGLVHIDTNTDQTIRYRYDPKNPHSLAEDMTWTVYIDRRDRIWVGTGHGLDLFNPDDQTFTHFLPQQLQSEDSLSHKLYVHAITERPNGNLWVGFSSGLYAFDPETGSFDLIRNHFIWSMYEDRQETVWLTSANGLFQTMPQSRKFAVYRQFGEAKVSSITSLAEDTAGNVWISGYDLAKGDFSLFRFDPASRHFFPYPQEPMHPQSSLGNGTKAMIGDNHGWLWAASRGKIDKFNIEQQTFSSITLPIDPKVMFKDSRGDVWLGEWGGVGKYDPKTETYKHLEAFPSASVHSLLEDKHENLWIGTTEGLVRYSLKTDQIDIFQHDHANLQSLSNNEVHHLMMDQNSTLWVGTAGGLNQMIPGTEKYPKFKHWRTAQSDLPHDDIYYIIDGGDESLWISCGNGISHFFPQTGIFRNYDYHDGLPDQIIERGLKSHKSEIYFGSNDGLVVFHPDSLHDNPHIPAVTITDFSIHNQPVPVQRTTADTLSWKTPLNDAISYTNEMELEYQQNDFSFEFAALNYVNPEKNHYKYKLEPYEKDWIETSAMNRMARYTNISPGRYTFRVIASNNDGVWNQQGATLSILIHPPWWRTTWAYLGYGLLFITSLVLARKVVVNRERLRAELRVQQVASDKLRELDTAKSRFLANISHEFRTPLSLISGTVQKLNTQTKLTDEQKTDCSRIDRNANRLLELINQLLDLSKLEAGQLQPHLQTGEVTVLLGALASSFESMAQNKDITYRYSIPLKAAWVSMDKDKLEKIINNLLTNALKFTPAGGKVAFTASIETISIDAHLLKLLVEDTGVGIPAQHLPHIFDRFYQVDPTATRNYEGAGIGLALTKELVALLCGTIHVESQEGQGSAFYVAIPLKATTAAEKEESYLSVENPNPPVSSLNLSPAKPLPTSHPKQLHATKSKENIVLVVEDNLDLRQYLKEILSPHYQVMEAADGQQGLLKAWEAIPDLIISDVMMPGLNGVSMCQQLKSDERTSHVPIILLTAKAGTSSKLLGLETGADDYLIKPFQLNELLARVKNLLDGRKKLREQFGKTLTLQPQEVAVTSTDERFLQKALAIMEVNMGNDEFDVETLGREIGMSRSQLHRKLSALINQSPSDFIRQFRLQRAAHLLQQDYGNISEVALAVGFSSLNYFTRCFRGMYGKTPSEYARRNTGEQA